MYLLVDNAVQIVRSGTSQDAKDVVQLKIHSEVFIAWEFKPSILTQTKFIELVTNSKKKYLIQIMLSGENGPANKQ